MSPMKQKANDVVVVMVPLPAQGHLNQLLHLTRMISKGGIPVYFFGSSTHNRQAKDRVHGWDPSTISNIHFHDFQLEEFNTLPGPNRHDSNKFPSQLLPTLDTLLHLQKHLSALLRDLSSTNRRRVVVIHDVVLSFAAYEASLMSNVEAYCFNPIPAFTTLHFTWEALGRPADEDASILPLDVPRISFEGCLFEGFSEYAATNLQWMGYCAGDIYNSCDAMEGRFINMLAQRQPADRKLWTLGPLNPVTIDSSAAHKCLEWLDKQSPSSVIYVSFGSSTSTSDDQIAEIATGLERSEQRFIWVLRDTDRGDIYKQGEAARTLLQLPDGYEERIKGVGMIVRDWAPQLQILAHTSTGGFLSHCGWNSSMESLSMGVPIAAWPMHSDQPGNALLITQVLKVGILIQEWAHREELVTSDIIERSVRKLMVSEEGDMMRKRAKDLGIDVRRAVSDGGSSAIQLESFLAHISR